MKTYMIAAILAICALTACGKSNDNEYVSNNDSNSPAVSATAPVPATSGTVNQPQTIDGSSEDVFKAQSAQKTASVSPSAAALDVMPTAVAVASPAPIDAINDQLAKLGSLSVTSVNAQGYPVFEMECNKDAQCVNGVGIPMGNLSDIAAQMTTVKQSDIQTYGYHCTTICVDGQNHIIGRPEVTASAN